MRNKTDPQCKPEIKTAENDVISFIRNICIALASSFLVSVCPAFAEMEYEGVNISGAEWAPYQQPGTFGVHYIYPRNEDVDYFQSKGMNIIRVPFLWERMQREANQALDATELSRLDAVVNYATGKGMAVIIDPHNYGAYKGQTIGTQGGHPNSVFTDLWVRLADHYKSNPKVIFGLMNEPVGSNMTAQTWLASSQAAINAIRNTGAGNHILVPSTYWMHPTNFVQLNASVMINVTDPLNNFSYDVHQYLDYDGSGTHSDYLSPTDAVATLSGFTAWLKANNKRAMLTEIGVTSDAGARESLSAMLQYMHENSDQWKGYTYWSAGPMVARLCLWCPAQEWSGHASDVDLDRKPQWWLR